MFQPDDPLSPMKPHFSEGWHAQALALADTMVNGGMFTASDWANALGQALTQAEQSGAPDTEETYYQAVLAALETLTETQTAISRAEMSARKEAWETAYRSTPHGQPVHLNAKTDPTH